MNRAPQSRASRVLLPHLILLAAGAFLPWLVMAASPSWWSERGVVTADRNSDDFAPANSGQLKYVAKQAWLEFGTYVPGGAGAELDSLIASWSPPTPATDDFAIVNLGQLKAVAKPFYDRLVEVGFTGPPLLAASRYPWSATTADDDDFAAANIGQLKYVFSFDLRRDSDGDGISDLFEIARGSDPTVIDPSGQELPLDPNDLDGDGLPNAWEIAHGLNPRDASDATEDPDADNLTNLEEYGRGTNPELIDTDGDGFADSTDTSPKIPNPQKPQSVVIIAPEQEQGVEDPDLTRIEVHWESDPRFVTAFVIERRVSGGEWSEAARVPDDVRSWPDEGLRASQRYYYRVTAIHEVAGENGGASEEARSPVEGASYAVPFLRSFDSRISYVYGSKLAFPAAFLQPSPPPPPPGQEISSVPQVTPIHYRTLTIDRVDAAGIDRFEFRRDVSATSTRETWTRTYRDDTGSATDQSWSRGTADESFASTLTRDANFAPSLQGTLTSRAVDEERFYSPNQPEYQYHKTTARSEDATYHFTASVSPEPDSETFYNPYLQPSQDILGSEGSSTYDYVSAELKHFDDGHDETENIYAQLQSAFAPAQGWQGEIRTGGDRDGVETANSSGPLTVPAWFVPDYSDIHQFLGSGAARTLRTTTEERWRWDQARRLGGELQEVTCHFQVSNEYTTATFIADTVAKMLPYSAELSRRPIDDAFMHNFNYSGAQRYLSASQEEFAAGKVRYRFRSFPSAPRELKWFEVFQRTDNPLTADVDETRPPIVVATRVWQVDADSTESPMFEIDPGTRSQEYGLYYIVFEPQLVGNDLAGEPLADSEEESAGLPLLPSGEAPPDDTHSQPYQRAETTFDLQIVPLPGATYTFDWIGVGLVLELNGQLIEKGQAIDSAQLSGGELVLNATADLSIFHEPSVLITVAAEDAEHNPAGTDSIKARLPQIELMVDANRDGNMSFDDATVHDADQTTALKPYTFWLNNDHDEGRTVDGKDWEEDDYPGKKDSDDGVVEWRRDLEDLTRLWVSFKGLEELLKQPGTMMKFEMKPTDGAIWTPSDGSPSIRVFPAYEKQDGGNRYLFDDATAWEQVDHESHLSIWGRSFGRAGRGVSCQLPTTDYYPVWALPTATNPNRYFLFEGVSKGKGRLILTIYNNERTIAEYPAVYIELKEAKEMFEYWSVGSSPSSGVDYSLHPMSSATKVHALSDPTSEEERDYVLFVHGWNMDAKDKANYAETVFKRLWHEGYKGQFGYFGWPTFYLASFPGQDAYLGLPVLSPGTAWSGLNKTNFDASEKNAWESGPGLLDCIDKLNTEHAGRVRVLAHSQGNIVVAEALRTAKHSQVLHTYVASQAALTAGCYDPQAPDMAQIVAFGYQSTPDIYSRAWTPDAPGLPEHWTDAQPSYLAPDYMSGATAKFVNFYNPFDYALSGVVWQLNQQLKPDDDFAYLWPDGFIKYEGVFPQHRLLAFPVDRFESMAFAAEARAFPLGDYGDTRGVFLAEDVFDVRSYFDRSRPQDDYSEHKYHSGQFRGTNMQRWKYWKAVLDKSDIQHSEVFRP